MERRSSRQSTSSRHGLTDSNSTAHGAASSQVKDTHSSSGSSGGNYDGVRRESSSARVGSASTQLPNISLRHRNSATHEHEEHKKHSSNSARHHSSPSTSHPNTSRGSARLSNSVPAKFLTAGSSSEHIRKVQHSLFHTIPSSDSAYHYLQLLHYPLTEDGMADPPTPSDVQHVQDAGPDLLLEDIADQLTGPPTGASFSSLAELNELCATKPPHSSTNNNSSGPANELSEAASFSNAGIAEDVRPHSVTVLALTTLPDPVSGHPVLGVCLGDFSGHIQYFEVSTTSPDATHSSSSSPPKAGAPSYRRGHGGRSVVSESCPSCSSHAATTDMSHTMSESCISLITSRMREDLGGREVARRHVHKAYSRTFNPLISVQVEPCVKCVSFYSPYSSPSTISYLAANERMINLYQVRRAGVSMLDAFPSLEAILPKGMPRSRYFGALPPQTNIIPVKEFGPVSNTIQGLSVAADGATFMSVEDLQVFWWDVEASDCMRSTCIVDLQPASGSLDEVDELVTAAAFHPTHSSLFVLSRSSGVLNIGDLRDAPSRSQRRFAITSQLSPWQNPVSSQRYDDILCSISAASFIGADHVVSRDYTSLKLWDLRKPDTPCAMAPVMGYISPFLERLYNNDSIFDRFSVAVDDVSLSVVTGLYDGAVAVWQPLTCINSDNILAHYRVDAEGSPQDHADGGRVSMEELGGRLESSWQMHAATMGAAGAPMSVEQDLQESVPEPFTNKVLNLAMAPGGERFGYTYKNGKKVFIFERRS